MLIYQIVICDEALVNHPAHLIYTPPTVCIR